MSEQIELIRLAIFFSVLVICALWESNRPRKTLSQSKRVRWLNNLGLVGFNSLLITALMPILAFSAAQWAQSQQFGLLYWLEIPPFTAIFVAVVLLDAVIYWQHLLFTVFLCCGGYTACTMRIKILMSPLAVAFIRSK